jgi:hypothetical protein
MEPRALSWLSDEGTACRKSKVTGPEAGPSQAKPTKQQLARQKAAAAAEKKARNYMGDMDLPSSSEDEGREEVAGREEKVIDLSQQVSAPDAPPRLPACASWQMRRKPRGDALPAPLPHARMRAAFCGCTLNTRCLQARQGRTLVQC